MVRERKDKKPTPTEIWADIYLTGPHTEGECQTCDAAYQAWQKAVTQQGESDANSVQG